MNSRNSFVVEYGLSALLWLSFILLVVLGTPNAIAVEGVLRVLLAVIAALFLPGYFIQTIFYPLAQQITNEERIGLSIGLSVAVIPILALILDGFGIPIELHSVVVIESGLLWVAMVLSLIIRRRQLPTERFQWYFHPAVSSWWDKQDRLTRMLLIALIVGVFTSLIAIGAISSASDAPNYFTEFYILNSDEKAVGYPRDVIVNQPVSFRVVIKNHETGPIEYKIEVTSGSQTSTPFDSIQLLPDQTFDQEVSFTPTESGTDRLVEFDLFRDDDDTAYRTVNLALNVNP